MLCVRCWPTAWPTYCCLATAIVFAVAALVLAYQAAIVPDCAPPAPTANEAETVCPSLFMIRANPAS